MYFNKAIFDENEKCIQLEIICNKCGKEIIVKNGISEEDVLSVEKRWGYFSNKDNDVHAFDLCEACYDEWTGTFAIPIERK